MTTIIDYLDLIQDQEIRHDTEKLLVSVHNKFKAPSTYTGLYHPEDERNENGLMTHTLRTCNLAIQLERAVTSDRSKIDIVIAGSLLHDVANKFLEDNGLPNRVHAHDNARWYFEHSELPFEKKQPIMTCILWHHGRWETSASGDYDRYPLTHEAWCVHQADNLASRGNILVDFKDISYIKENL